MSKKEIVLFILLSFTAFYLRLNLISDMEYKGEEKIFYEMANRISNLKEFPPAIYPTSMGIPNPPFFLYATAVIDLISRGPVGAAMGIAALNALAVIVFYLFARKRISPFVALWSSFLFATNFWAIIYSRKTWNVVLIAPLAVLLMISIYKLFEEKKTVFWIPFIISSIALLQSHYSTLFLVAAIPFVILSSKYRISAKDIKYAAGGIIACILSFIPLTIFSLNNSSQIIPDFMKFKSMYSMPVYMKVFESAKSFMQMITALAMKRVLGPDLDKFQSFIGNGMAAFSILVYTVVVALFIIGLISAIRQSRNNFLMRYCLIMLFSSIFYTIFISAKATGYCFLVLYPVPFIMIALGAEKLKIRNYIMAAIILMNIYVTWSFQRFIHINGGSTGDYGVAYRCQNYR